MCHHACLLFLFHKKKKIACAEGEMVPASHPQSKRTTKREAGRSGSDGLEQAQRGQGMYWVKEELKPGVLCETFSPLMVDTKDRKHVPSCSPSPESPPWSF